MEKTNVVELWCDGSGTTASNPGGWAFVLRVGEHEHERAGHVASATNQRMELTAAIEGLRALTGRCQVRAFSDSMYVVKGFTESRVEKWRANGWRTSAKKPVANRDLWEQLAAAAEPHEVEWTHVPRDGGFELNERVDELAGRARQVAIALLLRQSRTT